MSKITSLVQYSKRMWTCIIVCLYRCSLYPQFYQLLPNLAGVHKDILNSNFYEVIYVCQKCFNTLKLGYNTMKGAEYSVLFVTNVFLTKEINVMVHSEELIGTTKYLTL